VGGSILAAEPAPARRSFQTLDGLRAVGALIIVMRHVPLFGPVRVPESFLAVDLFYLVSGFVVAHAYAHRLAAGGYFWDFVKVRLIRLYPLYLAGLAAGVLMATASILQSPHSSWTAAKIAECVGVGLLMIPRFPALPNNGTTLDGPLWTLLYELIANFVYAAAIKLMRTWVLVAIMIVSGVGVITAELTAKTLDVGYNLTDQWAALARVGYSFFAGVLIYRLFGRGEQKAQWVSLACVAVLGVGLACHLPRALIAPYEIGMVLVGMPVLVIAAARFEPGPTIGRIFSWIGLMSYGIYCLHQPLGNLTLMEIGRYVPRGLSGAFVGVLFIAAVVLLCWALDVFYDAPLRRWLRARLFPGPPRRAGA
jgi:peptidoglycan/LPS O-acetylase OafA/YrhL